MSELSVSNSKNIIFDWEGSVNPLAPLSDLQKNIVLDLCQEIKESGPFSHNDDEPPENVDQVTKTNEISKNLETTRDFLQWFSRKEDEWLNSDDETYQKYLGYLENQRNNCNELLGQVEGTLSNLKNLNTEYQLVSNKTNSLHQDSEKLLDYQMKLVDLRDDISSKLIHFEALDRLTGALDNCGVTIHSAHLDTILEQLDSHIKYHASHNNFKESWTYLSRYKQLLRRALSLIKDTVTSSLVVAAQQAASSASGSDHTHYPRFQAVAKHIRPLIAMLESRSETFIEYQTALGECEQVYVREREALIGPSVTKAMTEIFSKSQTFGCDHCSMMRSACAFLIHVSQDEHSLYKQFFGKQTDIFYQYLESLCTCLYDITRPLVIHMKHLESLAELCSILRLEMLQEHVSNNRDALGAFGSIIEQLLQDVQERLVFRAHMYVQSDIAEYKPSMGDLAYPEKLQMMQSIAQSLNEGSNLTRSLSRNSLVSETSVSSQEVARINQSTYNVSSSSPADLHGMWYPPVRRTLVTLSKLYRCVERPTFQGISQQALSACITSVKDAAQQISTNKSILDGEMFQIKHLLILREQIAPFQVDFTVKEMSLDFSKTKTAAFQLLNKRTRLFSLSSNNALLEFLFEGSPEVREQWLDSRKDVDRALKSSCEAFIKNATYHLLGSLVSYVEKAKNWTSLDTLKNQPWATAANVHELVQSAVKDIKSKLPGLQATMQLYLANKDTEFILYRPIKNNVIGVFSEIQHLLHVGGYSEDEKILVGCPSPEQASILLSSASLVSH